MKRIILVIAAALILCGCTGPYGNEETVATDPFWASGLYDPEHPITLQTQGAVVVYPLKRGGYTDMAFWGSGLLLLRDGAAEVYGGEQLNPLMTTQAIPENFQLLENGIAWLESQSREVVFLNERLVEVARIRMPEDQIGKIWVASDGRTVYYCTATAVRALNLDSGISRLIYQGKEADRSVVKGLGDGKMLLCRVNDGLMLLSSRTGEVISQQSDLESLETAEDRFYLTMETEVGRQLVFGDGEGIPYGLNLEELGGNCAAVPETHGAVIWKSTEQGMELSYCDLEREQLTAQVLLSHVSEVRQVMAEPESAAIWLRCLDNKTGMEILCRWEPEKSRIQAQDLRIERHYTKDDPDRDSQLALRRRAEKLGEICSVDILLWEEAGTIVPQGYEFETAYLTGNTRRALGELEQVLPLFPVNFFATAAERTDSGRVHILLLDRITAQNPNLRSGEKGLKFWAGGELYIALEVHEGFREDLMHQIGHVIDNRVMSVCQAFDDWNQLNPQGFVYDNDFVKNLDRQDTWLLEAENRAFIDLFSMSFAVEDRSTVFAYACTEGTEDYFTSGVMQSKLTVLCKGIREAFGLTGEPGTYIWEQYLQ